MWNNWETFLFCDLCTQSAETELFAREIAQAEPKTENSY